MLSKSVFGYFLLQEGSLLLNFLVSFPVLVLFVFHFTGHDQNSLLFLSVLQTLFAFKETFLCSSAMNIQNSALSLQVAFDLYQNCDFFLFLSRNSLATQTLLLPHATKRLLQIVLISQN